MNRIEELKNLKAQLRESKFQGVVNDILSNIEQLNYAEIDKQIIKFNIELMIYKMCENEEILNDNLMILNQYASNGFGKRKRSK